MKTLVILSGAMRSFERCLPTLHWHVFRHLPNPSFVVSTDPDENAGKVELLRAKYPGACVAVDTTPQPKMVVPEGNHHLHAPYAISVPPEKVLGQLWRLRQSWRVAQDWKLTHQPQDSVVVRCRPDLFFHSFSMPHPIPAGTALTPWWGRFGGVNDRFSVMDGYAADYYFTGYDELQNMLKTGCPLHPESLIKFALLRSGFCRLRDTLRAEFSTLRTDGTARPPEISPIDIAHLAAASHD